MFLNTWVTPLLVCTGGGGGGGGGDMRINENSPRKWPKTHSQKLFLRINEMGLKFVGIAKVVNCIDQQVNN